MPKIRLPVFGPRTSTRKVMLDLTQGRARAGLIKSGPYYHVAPLDHVYKSLRGNKATVPLAGLDRITPLSVTDGVATFISGAENRVAMAAPIYVCPRGDQSAPTPALCTEHRLRMIRVDDET